MHRYMLRKPAFPPSLFPQRIRASTIGTSMWCDFQCRAKLLEPPRDDDDAEETEATAIGTAMHTVLEESQGRRFPHEMDFMQKIEPFVDAKLGFVRKLGKLDIYADITGHPDDLQVTPGHEVSCVEYKTTKLRMAKDKTYEENKADNFEFIKRWKFPMAELQCQVYAWILEPIVRQLGYTMAHTHAVVYYNSENFDVIGTCYVDYDSFRVEERLKRIMEYTADPTKCISPHPFKCRLCSREYYKCACINPHKCDECSRKEKGTCEECIKPQTLQAKS